MEKINSETAFFTLNGVEFEVKKAEAKKESYSIFVTTNEQSAFIQLLGKGWCMIKYENSVSFNSWIEGHFLVEPWQNYLINQARKRGFISGCHFSDGIKLTYMPSGRMKLLSLSKLVTDCRHPTVIYDNGKWCEVIKKEGKQQNQNSEKCRRLITELTRQIVNDHFLILLTRKEAKEIRDILNSKL